MEAHWTILPVTEFDSIAEAWDALNRETIDQAVLSSVFVRTLIEHFMDGSELIGVCRSDREVNAMGILKRLNALQWATAQPSQAPVGLWLNRPDSLTGELLRSLSRGLPGRTVLIDVLQLDSAAHGGEFKSKFFKQTPYITTSKLPVAGDFDEYFRGLGKNLRQNYNKSVNRLTKNGVRTELTILTTPESMPESVSHYGQLESSGWKAGLGTAVRADNPQGRFYIDVMETLAKEGLAEVWQYRFDDRVVAVDLCIKQRGILTILKTAFDENEARYSPSIMMKLAAVDALISRGDIREIEFFGRMMDWHRRLNSISREMFHLTWCRYPVLFSLRKLRKSYRRARDKAAYRTGTTHTS